MKILELYAGSRSIGKVAELRGHELYSVDIKDFNGIDLVQDIEFLRSEQIPFKPDMIWASPPCTTYSIAAISHHRPTGKPKSAFAEKSDRLILNTLKIIQHFNCLYYIENPRGMLRKMEFMQGIPRTTITYCSYGDKRMKPTDIWTNHLDPQFKEKCFNGNPDCHHQRAPRGSKTGTQGKAGNLERSMIPKELCQHIVDISESWISVFD